MPKNRHSVNPNTLLRLADGIDFNKEKHILEICGETAVWPGTIYRLYSLGYLTKDRNAWFYPTKRFIEELERAKELKWKKKN